MWQNMVASAIETLQEYGVQPEPPCPESDIDALANRSRTLLGMELPLVYKELLRRQNGLDWNGLVIYASRRGNLHGFTDRTIEGLIEANLSWRDVDDDVKDYLVLGDHGETLFAYHNPTKKYRELDTCGLTVIKRHWDCGSLFVSALQAHLP